MAQTARDRVTVDLRGLGERVRAQAAAQRLSAGAFVRRAILSRLEEGAPVPPIDLHGENGPTVKVTLRLSTAHAVLLTIGARRADVSQGTYVAGLIDGAPTPPRPPDLGPAIAALVRSTDQLAVLSTDVNGFMRFVRSVGLPKDLEQQQRLEQFRTSIYSMTDKVREHLATAAALMKDLQPHRRTASRPLGRLRARR